MKRTNATWVVILAMASFCGGAQALDIQGSAPKAVGAKIAALTVKPLAALANIPASMPRLALDANLARLVAPQSARAPRAQALATLKSGVAASFASFSGPDEGGKARQNAFWDSTGKRKESSDAVQAPMPGPGNSSLPPKPSDARYSLRRGIPIVNFAPWAVAKLLKKKDLVVSNSMAFLSFLPIAAGAPAFFIGLLALSLGPDLLIGGAIGILSGILGVFAFDKNSEIISRAEDDYAEAVVKYRKAELMKIPGVRRVWAEKISTPVGLFEPYIGVEVESAAARAEIEKNHGTLDGMQVAVFGGRGRSRD